MRKTKKTLDVITNKAIDILGKKELFYFILFIAVFQGVWYALSIIPGMFDEVRHIDAIMFQKELINPFIDSQPEHWDIIGNGIRDPSYLFYYLMSWPVRLIAAITNNQAAQVIALRLIMVGFFTWALFLWRKALLRLSISPISINVGLLFVVLTPATAPLAGTINYDNLIFFATALCLLFSIKVINTKRIEINSLIGLLATGMFFSVIKYTFLAIFIPILAYTLWRLFSSYGKKLPSLLRSSFKQLSSAGKIVGVLLLVISFGLFLERPIYNTVRYGNPKPACKQIIDERRCSANDLIKSRITLQKNRPADFKPKSPFEYGLKNWAPIMITGSSRVINAQTPTIVMHFLYYSFAFTGIGMVIYYLRDHLQFKANILLLIVVLTYLAVLFLTNYSSYNKNAGVVAVNARYFLPVLPILLVFVAESFLRALRKYRAVSTVLLTVIILSFSQGGGLISTLIVFNQQHYWNNSLVIQVNNKTKKALHNIVFERTPFRRL
ncbi:MAG: hypothetical protein U5K77_01960 [Candidatus Saccharibacteria bacterium]|nr:hypothetical protein [Candidatus Saccharibacteria bacterium]